jgi:hypothetical protein
MASIETGLINLAVGGGLDPELFKDDEAQPSLFTDIDGYRFTDSPSPPAAGSSLTSNYATVAGPAARTIRTGKDTGLRNPPLRGFDQNRSGASWWPTRWVNQIAQSTTSSDSRPGPGINTLRPNTCIHQSFVGYGTVSERKFGIG